MSGDTTGLAVTGTAAVREYLRGARSRGQMTAREESAWPRPRRSTRGVHWPVHFPRDPGDCQSHAVGVATRQRGSDIQSGRHREGCWPIAKCSMLHLIAKGIAMRLLRSFGALLLGGVLVLAAALAAARPEPMVPAVPLAGGIWREPITGMELVYMPGGEYEQGCGAWTSDCQDDERPTRKVRLSPFWLGKTEVTQGQWKAIMGGNPAFFQKGDDYPVEQVSWGEAKEFIRRLNTMSEQGKFRLPSEAEWEYACRAGGHQVTYGTQTGQLNISLANYSLGRSVAVGRYPANALGLFDMTGNVWEWTEDVYDGGAYTAGPANDPIHRGSGATRVLRGGGWSNDPRSARCSFRNGYAAAIRDGGPALSIHATGLRLVRTR